ncbi:restriction endonuclease subunit S [Palaeococcus ferrophilus]|uniref:restriction endonuclease subunit S n=1 Tax=Palaeococcus ferrophilus TaxID=83868 RepID=UPI000697B034|nr:restriction endonuclease subunit S [Palaeococcus ferrophilus]
MKEKPLTAFLGKTRKAEKAEKKAEKPKKHEGPWELPEGWRWVRLGDLGKFGYGYTASAIENNTGVKFLRITDIDETGNINWEEVPFCEISKKELEKYRLRIGDLLFARIGATTGKATYIDREINSVFASYLIRLKVKRTDVFPKFVFYFAQTPYYWANVKAEMGDKLRKGINAKELSRILVPLPPLEEQKRIVAKLDEVSKRLEEAKRLAREAREEAENLVASALHEVFSRADKRGWEWVRLGEVAKDMKPGFARNKKHISEDGVPHLRPNNIDVGHLNLEKVVKVKLDEKINIKDYYLQKGDVLFNNTNSFELVGRAALVTEELPWGYSNHITRIRVKEEVILPEWLTVSINYLWMQGYFRSVCTRWVGQAGVNMDTLKKTPIPLPPLEEQKRIVAYLDRISERAQKLVKLYEEREKELERLFPSILDRAFRGEL